jgi:hypothetical protein
MKLKNITLANLMIFTLVACGGDSDDDGVDGVDGDENTPQYSIGGQVNGLNGELPLLLQIDGQNTETIILSGSSEAIDFAFEEKFNAGKGYNVDVYLQPTNQICTVSNGSGTLATSNVDNITITCEDVGILTGVFLDSAVANVNYQTDTVSGTTNNQGEFTYVEGEFVSFSIGEVVFPLVPAASVITPLELANTIDITEQSVVNMTRFLQSLDKDGDPSNGIEITDTAKSSATAFLNFNIPVVDFASSADVLLLLADAGQDEIVSELVDIHDAIVHLEETLIELSKDETISFPGTWRISKSYDICSNSFKVNAGDITLDYSDGEYTYHRRFNQDIILDDEEGGSIRNCTSGLKGELDENGNFQAEEDERGNFLADENLNAAQLKTILDDSEIRSVIINSPDQITVTSRFRTGLENELGVDATEIWSRDDRVE